MPAENTNMYGRSSRKTALFNAVLSTLFTNVLSVGAESPKDERTALCSCAMPGAEKITFLFLDGR